MEVAGDGALVDAVLAEFQQHIPLRAILPVGNNVDDAAAERLAGTLAALVPIEYGNVAVSEPPVADAQIADLLARSDQAEIRLPDF